MVVSACGEVTPTLRQNSAMRRHMPYHVHAAPSPIPLPLAVAHPCLHWALKWPGPRVALSLIQVPILLAVLAPHLQHIPNVL